MILQKSARFLMICLCAIIFHGNVFGDDSDPYCAKIGWGKDESGDCVKCTGTKAAIVMRTYTLPDNAFCENNSVSEYDFSFSDTGQCKVNGHNCSVCKETANNLYPNQNHSACMDCKTGGYGVVGDVCVKCGAGEYSFTIPETNTWAGLVLPAHNICITDEQQDTMNCEGDVCTCKDGYYAGTNTSQLCQKCTADYYSNSTTGGKCIRCEGVIKTEDDELNVGCELCPEGRMPNSEHTSCVCKEGYGANDRGDCVKCGDGTIPVLLDRSLGYGCKTCEFGKIPQEKGGKLVCDFCPNGSFPNLTQTECVTSCEGTGIGKFEEDGVSQCVKCSEKNMTLSGGECVSECPNYQVKNNGECGSCEVGKVYDMVTKGCVDIDSCPSLQETGGGVLVCCEKYKYFDQTSGQCESCAKNEWFNESCQTCPKNFSCNGETKTKCLFGKVSGSGVGKCGVPSAESIKDKGFLHKLIDGNYEVIGESVYNSISAEDTDYFGEFEYASCSDVNGYSDKVGDIQICRECDKETQRPFGSGCVCGQRNNPDAGIITDITETREYVCQKCPNGLFNTSEEGNYVCEGCSDGEGFYWNGTRYVCAKCGGKDAPDTALYTVNGYGWCLTHKELKNVITEAEANRYYKNNGKWELCPAGYCCLGGDKSECNRGTFSLYEGGLACQNEAGICLSCGGKTTKDKATYCQQQDKEEDWCRKEMCTESITPTTFCIGEYKNYNENMCFNIDNIKMTLASGVYNTKDVTGDDTDQ